MRLEQMLNSTGSGTFLDGFNDQINKLNKTIGDLGDDKAAQLKRQADFMGASNNWGKVAWEDSESKWRKGDYGKFYTSCVGRVDNPCIVDNQTGRKDRYQDRLAKAKGYWTTAQQAKDEAARIGGLIADAETQLATAEAQKAAYTLASAEGAKKGQDPTQIDTLYQQQLDNLRAEEQRLEAEKRAAEKNPNTKYFIIGGIALVGLVAFLALRKKK